MRREDILFQLKILSKKNISKENNNGIKKPALGGEKGQSEESFSYRIKIRQALPCRLGALAQLYLGVTKQKIQG